MDKYLITSLSMVFLKSGTQKEGLKVQFLSF